MNMKVTWDKKMYGNYLRELICRQNRDITSAQLYSIFNIRGYKDGDIKEFNEIMKKGKQIDLDNNEVEEQKTSDGVNENENKDGSLEDGDSLVSDEFGVRTREIKHYSSKFNKYDIKRDDDKKGDELSLSKSFIYGNRVILVTDDGKYTIIHNVHLFDNLIEEFTKIYNYLHDHHWLSTFNFLDRDGNVCSINDIEVKSVIDFFDKLNRMKKDNEDKENEIR